MGYQAAKIVSLSFFSFFFRSLYFLLSQGDIKVAEFIFIDAKHAFLVAYGLFFENF